MSLILITHDLAAVAEVADRIIVMYAGEAVETGSVDDIFYRPSIPTPGACWPLCPGWTGRRMMNCRPFPAIRPTCWNCPRAAVSGTAAAKQPEQCCERPPLWLAEGGRTSRCFLPMEGGRIVTRSMMRRRRNDQARSEGAGPGRHLHQFHRRSSAAPGAAARAVDGISFELHPGETLGVVGESGSGKSTLARAILGLIKPDRGRVMWQGEELTGLDEEELRQKRKELQIVFQDPVASLDPRMTAGDIIAEPLWTFYPNMERLQVEERTRGMMKVVGLLPNQINRYPHEFSGGQCQRIGIARSLVLNPRLLICDEPVSALDVSIQAQIINLLKDLQKKLGLALIFIAHDLSVVRHISDRVMVMYMGQAMEVSEKTSLYRRPLHPYTNALMKSVPIPDPKLAAAAGRTAG